MATKVEYKIEAHDRTIYDVLNEKKYSVDFFQREYNWGTKHIEQLVTDLTSAFWTEYSEGDPRKAVQGYNNYYLGPFVVSEKNGARSIIDGQQRLTSITLLLIYLNNLQKDFEQTENIEPMIFSEKYGEKTFNLQVEERISCLEKLFSIGEYSSNDDDDASVVNMASRYQDIAQSFPDEIKGDVLPHFLDWLRHNVVLVEIIAYSDDNAYTIFETMNDRGLNLTPTEMLKGYILSRFDDPKKRQRANGSWRDAVQKLQSYEKDEDQRFFQAWLRSQYAETIRVGKAGSKNEDFEKIGTRFHSWVRDSLDLMGLRGDSASDFEALIEDQFSFYLRAYLMILEAEQDYAEGLEHIFCIHKWGIASSLSYPLLLAPLTLEDDEAIVRAKLNIVARYIETFVVRRSVNFRRFASSSIRYTMYTLVKEIRGKSLEELKSILVSKLAEMEEGFDGVDSFSLHGQNKRFVRFLLARMTGFIEQQSGENKSFASYYPTNKAKPFEVEHIWADKFEEHRDEFAHEAEFKEWRNKLGDLVLLPRGINQSYGSKPYKEKLKHYVKCNLLVQSLCDVAYENSPAFKNMYKIYGLPFRPHPEFKKADIQERQALYRKLCEVIWNENLEGES